MQCRTTPLSDLLERIKTRVPSAALAMPVSKTLDQRQIVVVTAAADISGGSYLLQRVNDDQASIRMLVCKLAELPE